MNIEEEINKKWNTHKLIQEAIKTAHYEPSPETKTRLLTLENNQNKFMEKLEKFEEKLEQVRLDIASLPERIFEKGDERYASKTSERVIYGMAGAFLLGIVYAILEIVIK